MRLAPSLCIATALLTSACQTTTNTQTRYPQLSHEAAIDAPADLHDIAGALLQYRATYRLMPADLDALNAEGLLPAGQIQSLNDYAYAPGGLARLTDGRVVVVVDVGIRVADHLWCIVREAADHPRDAALTVQLVPLPELDAAAGR